MSVSKNITEARNQALRYALQIAEERGVEGLREEISKRGIMGISILAPAKEVLDVKVAITKRTIDVIMLFTIDLLTREFGFDEYDAKLYQKKFKELTWEIELNPEMSVEEYAKEVSERVGFDISISKGIDGLKK